jgi:hypothetical protein
LYLFQSYFVNKKVIKDTINIEQRGRVLSWEKHQKMAAQGELEAAIRGNRSLPQNDVGIVHNFQDILTMELDGYLPGSSYLHRRTHQNLQPLNEETKKIIECKLKISLKDKNYIRLIFHYDEIMLHINFKIKMYLF